MTQANELRTGNVFHYQAPEGEVLTTILDWEDIRFITEDPDSFNLFHSPIELTEQVLLNCGFSPTREKGGFQLNIDNLYGTFIGFAPIDRMFVNYRVHNIEVAYPVYYLHQLQNLFFALTGQELTYKPTANEPT